VIFGSWSAWHSTSTRQAWLPSYARRSFMVRLLQVLMRRRVCSCFRRMLHVPLRCFCLSYDQTFTQRERWEQTHFHSQHILVPVMLHALCPRVHPLLYHVGMPMCLIASKLHIHLTCPQSTTGVVGFGNETHEHMAADVFISVTDLIGQLILIVRCWLLWDNNYWVIILPTLCAIGGLGMS
jgi:hypothetical protein